MSALWPSDLIFLIITLPSIHMSYSSLFITTPTSKLQSLLQGDFCRPSLLQALAYTKCLPFTWWLLSAVLSRSSFSSTSPTSQHQLWLEATPPTTNYLARDLGCSYHAPFAVQKQRTLDQALDQAKPTRQSSLISSTWTGNGFVGFGQKFWPVFSTYGRVWYHSENLVLETVVYGKCKCINPPMS